ncbi:MAG: hypothetical protein JJU36_04265 [Phycisphaeraceae bacterium]|nr:hypothetical protein [Phycisphaeraceae bacterium]
MKAIHHDWTRGAGLTALLVSLPLFFGAGTRVWADESSSAKSADQRQAEPDRQAQRTASRRHSQALMRHQRAVRLHEAAMDCHQARTTDASRPCPRRVAMIERRVIVVVEVHPASAAAGEAWTLFNEGHHDRSLDAFARLTREHPDHADALLGHALSAAMRNQDVAAARLMRQAMDRDPHLLTRPNSIDPEALRQLAHRYRHRTGPDMEFLLDAVTTLESA